MRLILVFLLCCLLAACNSTSKKEGGAVAEKKVHELLDPNAFQQKIETLDQEMIIDVRTPEELQETGQIVGALNVDYNGANFKAEISKLNKEKPIMVYCKSGGRSGKTATLLKKEGFKEVYDLDGGIQGWKAANLPLSASK